MGSPNEFRWLAEANVTSHQNATETPYEIPLRLTARAFACSLTLNPQKFDCAQDDRQWVYWFIFVRFRDVVGAIPYQYKY